MPLRRYLRRSRLTWWIATTAVAVLTMITVARSLEAAKATTARWGPTRNVVVALHRIDIGQVIARTDVEVRAMPASVLPTGVFATNPANAVGRVAVLPIEEGEVLLATKLAPEGLRGAAALLPAGRRALAIPSGPTGRPPVRVGDVVDVLATFDPSISGEAPRAADSEGEAAPTFPVATRALVLHVDRAADTVTVAVTAEEAPRLAYALSTATVTLALTSISDSEAEYRHVSGDGQGKRR